MKKFLSLSFSVFGSLLLPLLVAAQAPAISYLIPDIGAPGTNTYIEIIAPYDKTGSFGTDGMFPNNPGDLVRVICANAGDSAKITFGPVVVSWQGRVISTQIFVGSCVTPNSTDWRSLTSEFAIPLNVIVNGVVSNVDTFYAVKPMPALVVSGGGIFGSGGVWGVRSKRGALLFDSIILTGGHYTVSTNDCDLTTPGNEGYLPATIMSLGPVSLLSGASLSVSATGEDAGPGGGGGSMGDGPSTEIGGGGFVGGSPGESQGVCPATGGIGTGGVGDVDHGGIGLNGIMPEPSDVIPQCEYYGGTGNPFVAEGGGVVTHSKHEGDGNGGGFGTAGENGRGERGSTPDVGGVVNGNPMLVPLMGGSGGGGANEFCTCASTPPGGMAGGGGGGLRLYAYRANLGSVVISSEGASGVSGGVGCVGHGSIGGCGSGGAIVIQFKGLSSFPSVSAAGGKSIHSHLEAGNGGDGRARFDGPVSNNPSVLPSTVTMYRGPSLDTAQLSKTSVTINGTGNGNPIRLYSKTGHGEWQLLNTLTGYANNAWTQNLSLDPSNATYIVALQQVPNPSKATATLEPGWIMSQAAAALVGSCCTAGDATFLLSSTPQSFAITRCGGLDTAIGIGIVGCATSGSTIDSMSVVGWSGFKIADKRAMPRTIGASDSIALSYIPSGHFTDTAKIEIHYHLGAVRHDTSVTIVGEPASPFLLSPAYEHIEVQHVTIGQSVSLPLGVDVAQSLNLDSLWPYVQSMKATVSFDSSALSYASYVPGAGWTLTTLANRGNAIDFEIKNVSSKSARPLDLGTMTFMAHAKKPIASLLYLDSLAVNVSGKENVLCLAREEDRVWEVEITSSSGVATYEPLSKDGERVQVFPNPTSNMITIRDAGGEMFSASLYDALGREVVFARAMESGVCSMDVEALASGSYVLVCRLPGEVVTRRVNVLRR